MIYVKDFTIRPKQGQFLLPLDIAGKLFEREKCCVKSGVFSNPVVAFHRGGYFFISGSIKPLSGVSEATPIPPQSMWPAGCDWAEDDWTERGIYPPRPVQDAVLLVTMPNGRIYEVTMPFTDERPGDDADERERYLYEFKLALNVMRVKRIYGVERSAIKWAWEV